MHTPVFPTDSPRFSARPVSSARISRPIVAALVITGAAASLAYVLASVLQLPEQAVVITVMTLAFVASWANTYRRPISRHRVTLIPAPVRIH